MPKIDDVHDELEQLNREREAFEAEARERALGLATTRNLLYREAMAKRDAAMIGTIDPETGAVSNGAIDNRTGRMVVVVDRDKLDKETLAVLEHMGTPVPPLDELFPDGLTYLDRKGK